MAGSIKRALPKVSGKARSESITQQVFFGLQEGEGRRGCFRVFEPGVRRHVQVGAFVNGQVPSSSPEACILKPEALRRYIFLKNLVTETKLPITPMATPTAIRRSRVEKVFTASLEIGT